MTLSTRITVLAVKTIASWGARDSYVTGFSFHAVPSRKPGKTAFSLLSRRS